jgi:chemotaxis protein MotB
MQESGMRPNQVAQVRGFADQRLRMPNDPLNPANRRVSLIIQYLTKKPGQDPGPLAKPGTAPNETTKAAPPPKPETKALH